MEEPNKMSKSAYNQLENYFNRIGLISDITGILHWDSAAIMPKGGASSRSEQLAELRTLNHEILIKPELENLINEAQEKKDLLDAWQEANLRQMSHQFKKATSIPIKLVRAFSKATSKCETVWRNARDENDFKLVNPFLKEVLNLTVQIGQAKSEALNQTLYNALLDDYEPGGESENIDILFSKYTKFLPDFLDKVLCFQKAKPEIIPLTGPFPIKAQKNLGLALMDLLGFDFNHGRLDISHHPFCGGTSEDIRITTRYDEDDFTSSLMGVLHETGHALYEMGLPKKWQKQPVGRAMGMSIHESQSLLFEMQVCRSENFLNWAAPIIQKHLGGYGPAWEAKNLYRLYTQVQPSLIRVDADEVTYPAHIILRYQLERAMINKDLTPNDLPAAWNDGMRNLLGITPPTDREGCMQDIHWYDGAWGYFPTYTLGAMTAAQIFKAACDQNENIMIDIRKGIFEPLRAWLTKNIYQKGRLLPASKLLKEGTGEILNSSIFISHLKSRYLNE